MNKGLENFGEWFTVYVAVVFSNRQSLRNYPLLSRTKLTVFFNLPSHTVAAVGGKPASTGKWHFTAMVSGSRFKTTKNRKPLLAAAFSDGSVAASSKFVL
jgi:hypothetical protein